MAKLAASVPEYAAAIQRGSRRHLARAITWCESARADHQAWTRQLLIELGSVNPPAIRVGISGVPGAGKSTFINAFGMMLLEAGHRVAVLAVDPTSPKTGGSVLGDRTRMIDLANRPGAFIRPSPTSGHLGGVARATREAMVMVESAGYDVVLVETVGVGQSEVAVADMVDSFVLLGLSRSGDQLQGIKRGILELADLVAINKADGPHEVDAKKAMVELRGALRMLRSGQDDAPPTVLTCSALTKAGLPKIWEVLQERHAQLTAAGLLQARRAAQHKRWLWALVENDVLAALHADPQVQALTPQVEEGVMSGRLSAADGAQQIMQAFRS